MVVKKTTAAKAPVKKVIAKTTTKAAPAKKVIAKAAPVKTTTKTKVAAADTPVKKGAFGRPATTGARKAPARPKRKPVLFAAPADFKPHFMLLTIRTERDGLIAGDVKATRYLGRFDLEVEDKKKFDLEEFDQPTLRAIAARFAGVTFKATQDRFYSNNPAERIGVRGSHRLPKSETIYVLIRAGSRKADGSLMVGVKKCWQKVTKKSPKTGKNISRLVELEKTDPVWRMMRRATRVLPAAFTGCLIPPKRTRGSRASSAEE